MTIEPTHKCFDDALDLVESIAADQRDGFDEHRYTIVHAIVCPVGFDRRSSHAWVELREGCAVFAGIVEGVKSYYAADVAEYRAEMRIEVETRYTVREAWQQNKAHGTYGPWENRYLELCVKSVTPLDD